MGTEHALIEHARPDAAVGRPYFGVMRPLDREIMEFERDVLMRSWQRMVLAEFWAPWCPTCTVLRVRLERLAAAHPERFTLASVNVEMHGELLEDHGIEGIPTVKVYVQGRGIGELTGVVSQRRLEGWLDGLLASASKAGLLPGARGAVETRS